MKQVSAFITPSITTPTTYYSNNIEQYHHQKTPTAFVRSSTSSATTGAVATRTPSSNPVVTTKLNSSVINIEGCNSGCQCDDCQPKSSSKCTCTGGCRRQGGDVGGRRNDNEIPSVLSSCTCSCDRCVVGGLMSM